MFEEYTTVMDPPQAKRIKLEHSYANDLDSVTIKEEDPLKIPEYNEITNSIKVEVEEQNVIKTEPEDVGDCKYQNTDNESVDDPVHSLEKINSGDIVEDSVPSSSDQFCRISVRDPLELRYEVIEVLPPKQPPPLCRITEKMTTRSTSATKDFQKVIKERDNLQKQLTKALRELKTARMKEKSLKTDLTVSRASVTSAQTDTAQLKSRLGHLEKKQKANMQIINDLTESLQKERKSNYTINDAWQRTNRENTLKLEEAKNKLKLKEVQYKRLDLKCAHLTHEYARLKEKYESQKTELGKLKDKLSTCEKTHATKETIQTLSNNVATLTTELTVARRSNEELQKSLLSEKKMSRFFIKERDHLLEEQDARFKETDKELVKLKTSIGSLTAALTQKVADCRLQKEASKAIMVKYQRKSLELKKKMEELEKKEVEMSKRTCEYCGL